LPAIDISLRPLHQDDHPSNDLRKQQHRRHPKGCRQPGKLGLIPRCAHAHVQRKVAMDQRNREGLALVRLEIRGNEPGGLDGELQSGRGHRIASTATPRATKQMMAAQPAPSRLWSARACPPKKDIVIAAAAMRVPARERSSTTVRS
jgi:hypothetical protein